MNIVIAFPVTSAAAKLNRSNLAFIIDAGINHFYETPDREWFETDAVLRVSLGNFLFFSILSFLMVRVKNQKDPRDSLHHGGWMMKIICWCLMVIFMFFLPNEIISFYGKSIS
ncbi:putative serine incorporator/TMS membrane protein [Helianthus annuus]|nr:putative serine incorporator/TMS membrane protein [Helianthus annuus]KAJ0638875.1 putative serine incorporator/TMS membrane protein [Helianthus annuus]